MGRNSMGRNGYGPKWSWAEMTSDQNDFSLIAKFCAKRAESMPVNNNTSVHETATSHQDKKQVSSEDKLPKRKRKRGEKKSSSRAFEIKSASQHAVKKNQDSSSVRPAGQPKPKRNKTPAQVARDRARRKAYWKRIKLARKLRAENLAAHNQLQETEKVASPQAPVVSQPENSGCLDLTSAVSQSHRHLTIVGETAQVQLDLNKLSPKGGVEQSSILVENCEDSDVVCARCLKRGSRTELRRCAGCKKSFSYCTPKTARY